MVLSAGCLRTPSLPQGHEHLRQDPITRKIEALKVPLKEVPSSTLLAGTNRDDTRSMEGKGIVMSTLSKSERLRKTICGSCLIAAPALLLVGGLLHPKETTDPARQYEIIASNVDRWELAHWIITVSMLLMVGAVLGLAHQLHEQRPAEGILGGAVALVGVLALFAVAAAETVVVPELGRSSEAGAAALYERIFAFGSTRWTVLLVAVLLLPVGLVAMSYGLYRAQAAATWAVGALGLGALLFAVALPTGSAVVFAIGLAALLVGMAPIGWEVLGETDEQWQHPRQRSAHLAT